MCAGTAKAGLHFIGDAQAASRAHMFVNIFEITVWKNDATAYALD